MTGNDTDGSRTPDERANSEVSQAQNEEQDVKRTKRKKASRACFHCQKAHLTCDDSRPCQRCIKRGLDASCQDGIRKRAKYLQDIDNETQEVVNTNSAIALTSVRSENPNSASYQSDSGPQLSSIGSVHEGTVNLAAVSRPTKRIIGAQDNGFGMIGDNLLFDYPLLSSYDFDSKAANMEYSMLSNMLGNATTPGTDYGHSPDTTSFTSPGMNNIQRTLPSRQHTITPDQASVASESSWTQIPIGGSSCGGSTLKHSLPQSQSSMAYTNSSQTPNSNVQVVDSSNTPKSPMLQTPAAAMTQSGRHGNQYVDPHGQRPTPVARRPHSGSRDGRGSIYKAIIKPFSYTNGYHLLNTYLRSRFEKEDLLRIARAIVGYRPSFIALTKTLKEEDLIFMEVCFQRTLLEYEKFVGYSGTPTIIWRRTGQIELVGKEFCLLTQWSREQLLSKQTFIVELMDDSSVVEYFEKFSAHAFGDTSSVQTTCVLMTPQKRAVPCAFCFTIKRDVFDIPMMIVGNFLPVL